MIKDSSEEQIKVIYCEAGHKARIAEVDNNLGAFQGLVGGWIEEYMPYDDDIAIVCNEEGKTMGLPLNRAVTSEDGQLLDIIAGDFFICYAPIDSENGWTFRLILRRNIWKSSIFRNSFSKKMVR